MWTTSEVLIFLATSHVLLLTAALLRDSRGSRSARLAVVPRSFWLLTKEHFDEESRMLPSRWVVFLGLEGVSYLSWLVVAEGRMPESLFPRGHWALWSVAPRLLSLAILLHALLNVYVGARSDLLVGRLKLR